MILKRCWIVLLVVCRFSVVRTAAAAAASAAAAAKVGWILELETTPHNGKLPNVLFDGHESCNVVVDALHWSCANDRIQVSLEKKQQQDSFEYYLRVVGKEVTLTGTWKIRYGGLNPWNSEMSVLKNRGFGMLNECISSNSAYGNNPCARPFHLKYYFATFQVMAYFTRSSGAYIAAHDPLGRYKTFEWTCAIESSGPCEEAKLFEFRIGSTIFSSSSFISPFPIVLTALNQSNNNWYDVAMMYKTWVFQNSVWTRDLRKLDDRILNVTLWINSHWQDVDDFEKEGGNPTVLQSRVESLLHKLQHLPSGSVAIHHYEWDLLGFNDSAYEECPDEAIACGFDTNYPDYLPARDGFAEFVQRMESGYGAKVIPYVNGRLYDTNAVSYASSNARSFATVLPNGRDIALEEYGSGTQLACMCPATKFWQTALLSTVSAIFDVYKAGGVYVDQVGRADSRPCYSKSHDHVPGATEHWTLGYHTLLDNMQHVTRERGVIVTESNCEAVINKVDVYLALDVFAEAYVPELGVRGLVKIVPVFSTIYGGHVAFAGAEFHPTSLTSRPRNGLSGDIFAAMILQQLLLGFQLGWFSVGGAFSLLDAFDSGKYNSELDFVVHCANARRLLLRWLAFGHRTRDPTITTRSILPLSSSIPNKLRRRLSSSHRAYKIDDSVIYIQLYQCATFLDSSLLLLLCGNVSKQQQVQIHVVFDDLRRFGLVCTRRQGINVQTVFPNIESILPTAMYSIEREGILAMNITLSPREVIGFRIEC